MKKGILAVAALALLAPALAGCPQGGATPMTEKEKQDFKGGPMPPEARAKMAERMRNINQASPATPPK
jgi:hypothetical protein